MGELGACDELVMPYGILDRQAGISFQRPPWSSHWPDARASESDNVSHTENFWACRCS